MDTGALQFVDTVEAETPRLKRTHSTRDEDRFRVKLGLIGGANDEMLAITLHLGDFLF